MKEDKFYETLEKIEQINKLDKTEGYYPTIEEIEGHNVLNNPEIYLPIIAYFAGDPFKDTNIEGKNSVEYKATVKYCRDLLTKFPIE